MTELALAPPEPTGSPPLLADEDSLPLDATRLARIEAIAREFAGGFLSIELHDPAFERETDKIVLVGRQEMAALADQAHRALARGRAGAETSAALAGALDRLRAMVERLDPGEGDRLFKPRKLFGLVPVGNPVSDFFARYSSVEAELESILQALMLGRDRLVQDNIVIDADRAGSWPLLLGLAEASALCAALDARLDKLARQIDNRDGARARRLREGPLFAARQRHQDLLTQMAVAMQGYQLLGVMRSNNGELIKGVDRASATTMSALRTAIVAANTLTGQKLLLERIVGVTATAASALDRAAGPIDDANARIRLDGAEASAQVAALHRAFAEVQSVVDSIEMEQRSAARARRLSDLSASL